MKETEQWILAGLLTILSWTITKLFIIDIGFFQFLFIEILIASTTFFFNFVVKNKSGKSIKKEDNSDILDDGM